MLPRPRDSAHLGRETIEPRRAIFVGERDTGGHLRDILRRMKVVRVEKMPAEPLRQCAADRCLTAAADTHENDDHVCA